MPRESGFIDGGEDTMWHLGVDCAASLAGGSSAPAHRVGLLGARAGDVVTNAVRFPERRLPEHVHVATGSRYAPLVASTLEVSREPVEQGKHNCSRV